MAVPKAADLTVRLANWLVDAGLIVGLLIAFPVMPTFGWAWADPALDLGLWLLVYYFICEVGFRRTLGKLVTGTEVVSEDGSRPSLRQLTLRSICRLVPFDGISGVYCEDHKFWHDRWSNTVVVSKGRQRAPG